MDLLAETGCSWVRLQFTWKDLEPTQGAMIEPRIWAYQRIIELAGARDIKVLVDVSHAPEWAKTDDPTLPADPAALVVSPGFGANSLLYDDWAIDDVEYLETRCGLNDGEIRNYFDVFAIQAYGAGNSPDTYWPSNPADNPDWTDAAEFYFRHVEELHRILVFAGIGDKPIWIAETGWTTPCTSPGHGYGAWIRRCRRGT